MTHTRIIAGLTACAALLAAAAHLPANLPGAAAAIVIGALWLAAWRRGPEALVDIGLVGVIGSAAIGGGSAAVLSAAAALAAWDAMCAERIQRAYTGADADASKRDRSLRDRRRRTAIAAVSGAAVGLGTIFARAAVPDGTLSFGAFAVLTIACVLLVAIAVRMTAATRA